MQRASEQPASVDCTTRCSRETICFSTSQMQVSIQCSFQHQLLRTRIVQTRSFCWEIMQRRFPWRNNQVVIKAHQLLRSMNLQYGSFCHSHIQYQGSPSSSQTFCWSTNCPPTPCHLNANFTTHKDMCIHHCCTWLNAYRMFPENKTLDRDSASNCTVIVPRLVRCLDQFLYQRIFLSH